MKFIKTFKVLLAIHVGLLAILLALVQDISNAHDGFAFLIIGTFPLIGTLLLSAINTILLVIYLGMLTNKKVPLDNNTLILAGFALVGTITLAILLRIEGFTFGS